VRSGSQLGTLIGEAVMSYVMTMIDEALDTARSGQERAVDIGDAAGAKARKLSAGAADAAEAATARTKDLAREARSTAGRLAKDLKRKTKG
jgi:diacylglycerol kinase family enzyme